MSAYETRWADCNTDRWGRDLVRVSDGAEIANDYGEPEDKSFARDLAPVVDELNSLAARLAAAESSLREAREEAEGLRKALAGCLAYLWPTKDEGHTGFVDRLGIEFWRETGVWPHFKSAPMGVHVGDSEATSQRWSGWLEAKRDAAAEAARAALAAKGEG